MYKQNGSPDTCFEALIVRVPWPRWAVELESRYDNAKFLPVEFVDYTSGYDSECAVLFPETFSAPDRPPAYFGAIFCDREAERLRRVSGSAAEILRLNLPPDAACLLASPELSRGCLHRLGPDPRPHPHARRSAVRSVHDPPAQPLLDVLAGGAALRPDRVRGGGEARGRGLRARPSRPVRDPLRPAVPLPAHRRPGPQLRRPRRAAAVRVPPPRGLPALDRQPAGDRVGEGGRGRRQAPRAGRRALPLRHRPLEARAVDRRSRSGRHLRPADRGLGLGQGPPRPARGRGAEAARRSRPRRRVPAQPLLHAARAEAPAGARRPAAARHRDRGRRRWASSRGA